MFGYHWELMANRQPLTQQNNNNNNNLIIYNCMFSQYLLDLIYSDLISKMVVISQVKKYMKC